MSRCATEINHEGPEEHESEIFSFFVCRALRGGNYLFSPGKIDI